MIAIAVPVKYSVLMFFAQSTTPLSASQLATNRTLPIRRTDPISAEQQEAQSDYRFGTVHSVKGESCDAVMLVLKTKGANGKKYVTMLDEDLIQNEEMRIVYVALSRARKVVCMAVPSEDKAKWEAKFIADSKEIQ